GSAQAASLDGAGFPLRWASQNAAEDNCDFQMRFGRRRQDEPMIAMQPVQLRLDCDVPVVNLRLLLNGTPLQADLSVRRGSALMTTAAPLRSGDKAATLCLTFNLAASKMEPVERCTVLPAWTAEPAPQRANRTSPASQTRPAKPSRAADSAADENASAASSAPVEKAAAVAAADSAPAAKTTAADRGAAPDGKAPPAGEAVTTGGRSATAESAATAGKSVPDDEPRIVEPDPSEADAADEAPRIVGKRIGRGIEVLGSAGGPLDSVNGTLKQVQGAMDQADNPGEGASPATQLRLPPNHHWDLPGELPDVDNAIARGIRRAHPPTRQAPDRTPAPAKPASASDEEARTQALKDGLAAAAEAIRAGVTADGTVNAATGSAMKPLRPINDATAGAGLAPVLQPALTAAADAVSSGLSGPQLPRTLVKAGDASPVSTGAIAALGAALVLAGWRLRRAAS
ncbi:MAG: hypothetical protein NTZ05_14110, partial [Chloroflexi bacterium]|nr:hypothetical protein [Chloroflexota bacterium]